MIEIESFKARLTSELAELEARRSELIAELTAPLSPDLSEQATELEDDDPLDGQIVVLDRQILSARGALARIEDGNYGECASCGEAIAVKRLEAEPDAALCIDCAREKDGHHRR